MIPPHTGAPMPDWDLVPGDIQECLELAPLAILRAALRTSTLALMDAHPDLVDDAPDTHFDRAGVRVIRLADRLLAAIDDYRRVLARQGRDKDGFQVE